MVKTPRSILVALDRVTGGAPAQQLAAPEMLAPAAARHVERVRSIFDDENVIGAGVASKISENRDLGELSLVFYVKRKLPLSEIPDVTRIPPVVAGGGGKAVYTDVIEIGEVHPQLNVQNAPLKCGYSVSHVDGSAGTLGALVRQNKKLFILSNSHVLAQSGLADIGDTIIFPGPSDGGAQPADAVAHLSSFTPFEVDSGFVNTSDAALAEVLQPLLAAADADLFGTASPIKIATPRRGMRVIKRGRTSGDTESTILDTDFRIFVAYPNVGKVGFTAQVRCDRYTEAGDSGAIVIDKDTGAIVGLHFAGSGSSSIFTPIRTVVKALKFKF